MCNLKDCIEAARHLLKEGGRFIMVHRAEGNGCLNRIKTR